MANKVKFEKDIYVKDAFGVRRHAFVAGQEVDAYVLNATARGNTILNPEDLPQAANPGAARSVYSKPIEGEEVAAKPEYEFQPNEFENPPAQTLEEAGKSHKEPSIDNAPAKQGVAGEPAKAAAPKASEKKEVKKGE